MIDYPPDFPAAARAVVERALADAEDEFIAATVGAGPVRSASLPGAVTYVGMWDESDRAAVSFVLEVFETIVQASCDAAGKGNWPAEQLRKTTEDLLAQLTGQAYRQKHSKGAGGLDPMTLDDFTTIVHRRLRTFPFWSRLQDTLRELSAQTAQPSAPVEAGSQQSPRREVTLTERAAWLRHELDRRAMNLESLHRANGPDRKTTKKILAAQQVSENTLKRLAVGLSSVSPAVRREDIP